MNCRKQIFNTLVGLLLASSLVNGQVPTVSDCLGAISVCSDLYIENDSPVGAGNYTSEFTSNNCVSVEQNSVWYIFTVQETGNFGFLLTPNDLFDDYDWSLFNLTGKSCQDLQNDPSLIASCNAAGGGTCNGLTGATGNSIYNLQNFGCGNFPPTPNGGGFTAENELLSVEQGETFALCIINWTGSQNGYTLDFGLSQVDIFDGLMPEISNIELPATNSCTVESIPLSLSEYVTCNSVATSTVSISGQGGPYSASIFGNNCDNGGDFENEFTVFFDPPLQAPGNFTLSFDDQLQDLCGNNLEAIDFSFNLDDFVSNGEYITVDSICQRDSAILNVNSDDITDFLWNNGQTEPEISVENSGLYTVELTGDCLYRVDTFEVNIYKTPLITDITLIPSACGTASGKLEVSEIQGNGPFQLSLDNLPFSNSQTFQDLSIGIHTLEVIDINGCTNSEVYEILQASSGEIEGLTIYEVVFPNEVVLEPIIIGDYLSLKWNDPEGRLSCTDCLNPSVSSPTDAVFQLEVEDIYGCLLYKNFYLRVTVQRDFYAPTIFTPNGDQTNDLFFLGSGPEVEEILSLSIYSRWGEEVFSTNNIAPNDPLVGWDGTKSGRHLQPGIYAWKAVLKFVDGFIFEARGSVALVN